MKRSDNDAVHSVRCADADQCQVPGSAVSQNETMFFFKKKLKAK